MFTYIIILHVRKKNSFLASKEASKNYKNVIVCHREIFFNWQSFSLSLSLSFCWQMSLWSQKVSFYRFFFYFCPSLLFKVSVFPLSIKELPGEPHDQSDFLQMANRYQLNRVMWSALHSIKFMKYWIFKSYPLFLKIITTQLSSWELLQIFPWL